MWTRCVITTSGYFLAHLSKRDIDNLWKPGIILNWTSLPFVMRMTKKFANLSLVPCSGLLVQANGISNLLSCLCPTSESILGLDTKIPPIPPFDQKYTPYGNPKEDIPQDESIPHRKKIVLSHYFDANLIYNVLLGKSVIDVINFWNKTPVVILVYLQCNDSRNP